MSYPAALFDYAFSPGTVPRSGDSPSKVALMLAVANGTGRDVTCQQIGFTMTPGAGQGDLTENVDTIASGVTVGTHWTPSSDTPGTFSWTPDPGHEVLHAGESVAFLLTDITVNQLAGRVVFTVYETTDVPRQAPVAVTKSDTTLGITSFTAMPVQINPDQSTTLTWTTTGADHCTLSTGGPAHKVDLDGTEAQQPVATTTYTLSAEGKGTSTDAQVTVVVPEVRILDFRADPDQVAQGATTRLSWVALGASSAVVNPGRHSVPNPDKGTIDLPVNPDTPFRLKASSPSRSASQDCDVEVMPVDIKFFRVAPAVIAAGNTATLTWDTAWTNGCSIDPGIGTVDCSGSRPVTPGASLTYRLRASGLDPLEAQVTVCVGAAVTAFGFTADVAKPDQVMVTWATFVGGDGSATLTVSGGDPAPVAPTGSKAVPVRTDGWVTVTVEAVLGGSKAIAALSLKGPLTSPGAQFTKLQLAAPPGINTPTGTATVQWVAAQGIVKGRATNAEGGAQVLDGATGSVAVPLGQRPPGAKLWRGDAQIGANPMVHWEVT
jgi:hypothetical protein